MGMHAASLANSPRLQRVLALLSDGRRHSTLEITRSCRTVAASACIGELRRNGCTIETTLERGPEARIYYYRLAEGPPSAAPAPPRPAPVEQRELRL